MPQSALGLGQLWRGARDSDLVSHNDIDMAADHHNRSSGSHEHMIPLDEREETLDEP